MCLLIYKPAGLKIPNARLLNGDINNNDGAGFCYVDPESGILVDKGYAIFEEFYKAYLEHEDKELIIHFRAASPGMEISPEMCHPFYFESNMIMSSTDPEVPRYEWAMAHNGRLPWAATKDKSDTCNFAEELLTPLLGQNPCFLDFPHGKLILEKLVGDSNKLALMRYDRDTKKSKCYIINQTGGVGFKQARWLEDVWYSNDSYLPAWKPTPTGAMGGMGYGYGHGDSEFEFEHGYNAQGGSKSPSGPSSYQATQHQARQPYQNTQPDKAVTDCQISWAYPDKDGWFWNFAEDCWENKNTKHKLTTLTSRPNRPFYIEQRDYVASIKENKDKPKEETQIVPITVVNQETEEEKVARLTAVANQMRVDSKSLTKEEFHKKWRFDGTGIKSSIVVPRDAGVVNDGEKEDLEDIVRSTFNKKEQRRIRQSASDFWQAEFGKQELSQSTNQMRLGYMVHVMKNAIMPDANGVTVLKYILKHGPEVKEGAV